MRADALHGGMTQGARTRTLADFKDGYVNVLVATDVAARGIHVDGIDLVLNVDPAGDHKDYLHRSGRTARAGQSGTVVSLALPHQRRQIFRLMEDAGVDASRHIIGQGGAFDPEVAEITGARSLTEVQADSANNAAKQAEREVAELTRQLERAQRRATELREEADRLVARAATERGADPEAAVAEAASAPVPEQQRGEQRPQREGRQERGGDRGGFRRDERRDDRPSSYDRRERTDRRDRDDRGDAATAAASAGTSAVTTVRPRTTAASAPTAGTVTTAVTAASAVTVSSGAVTAAASAGTTTVRSTATAATATSAVATRWLPPGQRPSVQPRRARW